MSQRLYYNGIILTSTDENPYAQAVLTENGRIKEVFFNNAENIDHRFPNAEKMDLHGNVLISGFVDGHSHFLQTVFVRHDDAGSCGLYIFKTEKSKRVHTV